MNTTVDYDDDGYPIIATDEKLAALNNINEFLVPILKCKTQPAKFCDRLEAREANYRIQVVRADVDLYLRFGKTWASTNKEKSIVLARIGFRQNRKGIGAKFLLLINRLAQQYNYQYIAIECTNENSRAFAERFGFKPDRHMSNYTVHTDDLFPIIEAYCKTKDA